MLSCETFLNTYKPRVKGSEKIHFYNSQRWAPSKVCHMGAPRPLGTGVWDKDVRRHHAMTSSCPAGTHLSVCPFQHHSQQLQPETSVYDLAKLSKYYRGENQKTNTFYKCALLHYEFFFNLIYCGQRNGLLIQSGDCTNSIYISSHPSQLAQSLRHLT